MATTTTSTTTTVPPGALVYQGVLCGNPSGGTAGTIFGIASLLDLDSPSGCEANGTCKVINLNGFCYETSISGSSIINHVYNGPVWCSCETACSTENP